MAIAISLSQRSQTLVSSRYSEFSFLLDLLPRDYTYCFLLQRIRDCDMEEHHEIEIIVQEPRNIPVPGYLNIVDSEAKKKRFSAWMFLEIALVLASVAFLLSTIFIDYLHDNLAFRIIEFYKLATFALLLTASRLSSGLLIRLLLALLHGMFPNCHHLLYVGYSIRNNLKRFLIAASLVAGYSVLFGEISLHIKALTYIEKIFVVGGVVSFIWLFKSIVVKSLAAWFYVKTYHARASQCVYYRFLVESLSGLPLMEITAAGVSQKRLRRLKKFNPEKLSAWHIKKMMLHKKEGLASKFKTKSEAKLEAEKMFNNVANPSFEFIDLKDLQRFLGEDEYVKALSLFQEKSKDNGNTRISKKLFVEWMIRSFKRHRSIQLSLEDTDGVSSRINTVVNIVLVALLVALAFPLSGLISTPYFLGALAAYSFIATYLFGSVWQSIYDCMVLFYVIHPFDIDDECEIDKCEMVVDKMNLCDTVFIGREDKKHYIIPNTLLCTKSIMNNTRSDRCSWKTTLSRKVKTC